MLFLLAHLAVAEPHLLMAKATSTAPGSVAATCLLDDACPGTWRPTAVDNGLDEGVLFMFAEKQPCDEVEIELTAHAKAMPVATPNDLTGPEGSRTTTTDGGKTWRGACWPLHTVRIKMTGKAPAEIRRVRLFAGGKRVHVHVPRTIAANVTASSVLAPSIAYQPAHLFDSRRTVGWSADGKKTDGKGVIFKLTLAEPVTIAGLRVWNGYQRSAEHFEANGRVTAFTLRSGTEKRTLTIDPALKEAEVAFAPLTTKELELVVDGVKRGKSSRDLVISELRFIDEQGVWVHPHVEPERVRGEGTLPMVVDRAYSAVAGSALARDEVVEPLQCIERRMRLSSSGTFHLFEQRDGNLFEGSWQPLRPHTARIFGHHTRHDEDGPVTVLFSDELVVRPFAELGTDEQVRIVERFWDRLNVSPVPKAAARVYTRDNQILATGGVAELAAALAAKPGALAVMSSLFTDVMLPTDALAACEEDFYR